MPVNHLYFRRQVTRWQKFLASVTGNDVNSALLYWGKAVQMQVGSDTIVENKL